MVTLARTVEPTDLHTGPTDSPLDLSAAELRHGESFKWSHYAPDVLPLWVADMDFAIAPSIRAKLHARLDQTIGYHPLAPGDPLTTLLHAKLQRDGLAGLPERGGIAYLGGVVAGLYAGVRALTAPGDEVLTFTPIYPPFLSAIADSQRVTKHLPLTATPEGWRIDFAALEAALTPATRLILLCNPHNPTGRVWTPDELRQIATLAQRHGLWVVTDELHADLTLTGTFTPFAAVAPDDVKHRTVTLTGPCKTYNTAGLGIGAMVSHSPALIARMKKATQGINSHPSALAVTMWQAALEDDDQWRQRVLRRLRENRDLLSAFVHDHLPGVTYLGTEATYLAWLDYREHAAKIGAARIQDHLLKTAKVALNPGHAFGPGFEGFVRLNFATSRAILTDALTRLAAAHTQDAHRPPPATPQTPPLSPP